MYAKWTEKHLKKLPLFDSEAMSKAWTIRQSTPLKYNKKHIRFSFAEEQMEKSGCTFKDYSLFPCWSQQTAADCSQRCSCSCTRKPNADLLTSRQRVALFPVLDWTTWKKSNGESIVRNIKGKGGLWHKHDGKHRSTNQDCWLTACSSCLWLCVERWLRDAVRSGSTQQQTKDRQTDRRTDGTRLPHRLSVSRGRPSGTSDITHQEPITHLQ